MRPESQRLGTRSAKGLGRAGGLGNGDPVAQLNSEQDAVEYRILPQRHFRRLGWVLKASSFSIKKLDSTSPSHRMRQ
jgi:hypothetical protein